MGNKNNPHIGENSDSKGRAGIRSHSLQVRSLKLKLNSLTGGRTQCLLEHGFVKSVIKLLAGTETNKGSKQPTHARIPTHTHQKEP